MSSKAVFETSIPGLRLVRRGKVRDVYDRNSFLLMVTTDRISAYDWVLPTPIPDKGKILNQLSAMWFDLPHFHGNHVVTTKIEQTSLASSVDFEELRGRSMIVLKTEPILVECVVRNYLVGSGWKDYQRTGAVCGIQLPRGLREADKLPEPIFTPATKAESGHDVNITFEQMVEICGEDTANHLRNASLDLYMKAQEYALDRGIIIADTKLEFGTIFDSIFVIDEVFTPDSSRFWGVEDYKPGKSPPSFDKQYVRDYLDGIGWDRNSPPPELPEEVVVNTRAKYIEAFERLTGKKFE